MKEGIIMARKVEPRILSGFLELLPEDQIVFDFMKNTIEKTYAKYGFVNVETPLIEYSEVLLAKAGGETEKQIYRFYIILHNQHYSLII